MTYIRGLRKNQRLFSLEGITPMVDPVSGETTFFVLNEDGEKEVVDMSQFLRRSVNKQTAFDTKGAIDTILDVKANTLKEQLMLFVNCSVENPAFDSQTKDFMNTPIPKFGSTCDVSERFIEKIANKSGLGVMDMALSLTQVKENKEAKEIEENLVPYQP